MNENDAKFQLVIKEYESLKAELKDLVAEMNLMARYAVVGFAAIFTFITAKESKHDYDLYMVWIPLIMSGLFAFRTYSLYERLELISKYIEEKIESVVFQDNYGWETYLNASIRKIKPYKKSKAQISTVVFWIALLICCSLFPIFIGI